MFGNCKPQTTPTGTQSMPPNTTSVTQPSNTSLQRQPVGFETVLGANCSLKGELKSQANVRLDGTLDGSIEIDGNVLIGETARITANIDAQNVTIAGSVRGNVNGNRVQLLRTGRVWGDINAAMIVTEQEPSWKAKSRCWRTQPPKGFDHQLPAPEMTVVHPSAEDATSGEPVEVEMMDDHLPSSESPNSA